MSTLNTNTLHNLKHKRPIIYSATAFLLILSFVLSYALIPGVVSKSAADKPDSGVDILKGIWISYIDFEPAGLYNKDKEEFTDNADSLFKDLSKKGFNTVYFHVRPFNDSIYPDSSFKWCTSLSDKKLKYDALDILIKASHKYNIRFHAWINPYRITTGKIFNPGKKSSTNRIIRGVKEIITRYDVDGIHFDDYFYPSKKKGNQFYKVSIKKRKQIVNKMVKKVYKTIKDYDSSIEFGISPAGNREYAESIGCDIKTWVNNTGYVDYLIPQVYWSDNYHRNDKKITLFTDTLDDWTSINQGNVPLYTGLALYKSGLKDAADRDWKKYSNNIAKHIEISENYSMDGFVMFSYASLLTKEGKKEFRACKNAMK